MTFVIALFDQIYYESHMKRLPQIGLHPLGVIQM
jgi:hypothetical protein